MMIRTNQEIRAPFSHLVVFLFVINAFLVGIASGQDKMSGAGEDYPCIQNADERTRLVNEAQSEQFNVLFVEFWGNTSTNSRALFKITKPIIDEGDIFTKENLDVTRRSLSKVTTLYPLKINDERICLDRQNKSVNILFCVREKEKK